MTHREKWMARMVEIHGSEEAVRAYMSASAKKTPRTGKGGFRWLKANDPDKLKKISQLGGKSHGTNRTTDNSN